MGKAQDRNGMMCCENRLAEPEQLVHLKMAESIKIISPRGESVRGFFNPVRIVVHLWKYRDLIRQLTWREVVGRYKGSFIGLGWSFIQPVIMLCVYTFVFSVIFKARWGVEAGEGKAAFALALFMGLITFSVFSEVANSAPSLVLGNVNYVKKVVFPLEILPLVRLFSALINAVFSLGVLFAGILIINHFIHRTALLLPLIWLPMMLFTLGCGYFLASLGVFVRDIGTVIGVCDHDAFLSYPDLLPHKRRARRVSCILPDKSACPVCGGCPQGCAVGPFPGLALVFFRHGLVPGGVDFRFCVVYEEQEGLCGCDMMSHDFAIRANNLGKCYQIYEQPLDRLKQSLWRARRRFYREFWALRECSFEIKKGETVGIIGSNGSGKSTLLQIICGTLNPTEGELGVNGQIAALLELGAGFNPEFTGRENVYMSAAIMGISRSEIESRYDEIAAFADIGGFIEQPVKTYSSGMYVRLAFAVAVNVSPDILVVDEALAVGDARFQQKCMAKIRSFCQTGTVIFVSHDTAAVTELCSRAIWIESGRIRMDGPPKYVVEKYLQFMYEGDGGFEAPVVKSDGHSPCDFDTGGFTPVGDGYTAVWRPPGYHRGGSSCFSRSPGTVSCMQGRRARSAWRCMPITTLQTPSSALS